MKMKIDSNPNSEEREYQLDWSIFGGKVEYSSMSGNGIDSRTGKRINKDEQIARAVRNKELYTTIFWLPKYTNKTDLDVYRRTGLSIVHSEREYREEVFNLRQRMIRRSLNVPGESSK